MIPTSLLPQDINHAPGLSLFAFRYGPLNIGSGVIDIRVIEREVLYYFEAAGNCDDG
jgi:hypothetical protein